MLLKRSRYSSSLSWDGAVRAGEDLDLHLLDLLFLLSLFGCRTFCRYLLGLRRSLAGTSLVRFTAQQVLGIKLLAAKVADHQLVAYVISEFPSAVGAFANHVISFHVLPRDAAGDRHNTYIIYCLWPGYKVSYPFPEGWICANAFFVVKSFGKMCNKEDLPCTNF